MEQLKAKKKADKPTDNYSFMYQGRELSYCIQKPDFKQISAALSVLTKGGSMDLSGAGKIIFDLCCVECESEILDNPKLLLTVCLKLAEDYALPADIEIKKK